MRRDHHIHFADRAASSDQAVTVVRREVFQSVQQLGAGDHRDNTADGSSADSLTSIAGERRLMT